MAALVAASSTNLRAVGDVTVTGGTAQNTTAVSSDTTNNKGVVGSASAEGENLSVTNPQGNPENFLIESIDDAAARVVRTSSQGRPVNATSIASYDLSFEVGLNEALDVTFDMVTTLEQGGLNGEITWTLTGPGNVPISDISGSVTAVGTGVAIATQTSSLSQQGTYTLTVTASANPSNDSLSNANTFSTAVIESLSFQGISSIPEPSTLFLVSTTGLCLLLRRRRPSPQA